MVNRPAQVQLHSCDETEEEILPTSFVNGRLIQVAPLQTISLRGLRNESSIDAEKLRSAVRYPGFCYLDLGNFKSSATDPLLAACEDATRTVVQALMTTTGCRFRCTARLASARTVEQTNAEAAWLVVIFSDDVAQQYTFEVRMPGTGLENGSEWAHVVPKRGCALVALKGSEKRISKAFNVKDDDTWVECRAHQ